MKKEPTRQWTAYLTTRELTEVQFSITYVRDFGHGTDGHNAKVIIAKLAKLLDEAEEKAGHDLWPTPPEKQPQPDTKEPPK